MENAEIDSRLTKLEVSVDHLTGSVSKLVEKLDGSIDASSKGTRVNLGLVGTFLGILITVVGSVAKLQSSTLETRLAPIELLAEMSKERSSKLEALAERNLTIFNEYVASTNTVDANQTGRIKFLEKELERVKR